MAKDDSAVQGSERRRYECRIRPRSQPDKQEMRVLDAFNTEEVISRLHREGFLLVSAKVISIGRRANGEASQRARSEGGRKRKTAFSIQLLARVSTRELISFAIQLSALLRAGVPLLKSLQIVHKGTSNAYFRTILEDAMDAVNQGFDLSRAVKAHPKVFPSVWANLIQVGEASGNLPEVLREIAGYQEAAQRLKSKVVSAFFYPAILAVFATGAVGFLLWKIVPKFQTIFEGMNMQVPVLTKVVIATSEILRHNTILIVLLIFGVAALFAVSKRFPKVGHFLDAVRLKMPLMGKLTLEVSIVRFARGLATMIKSGVPILDALEIARKLTGNSVVEKKIGEAKDAVRGGHGLGTQLEARKIFPVFMTQLVNVGEESGELSRFLVLIASYYEERVDEFLGRLTTMLEPVMLVIMGSIIGVLVVSMFLPIIEISTGGH